MQGLVTQVAVRQDNPGTYEFSTSKHRWSYAYEVRSLGSRSETRIGKLLLDGKEIDGKRGAGVRTPWGLMQRFDSHYESGWLLECTYGHPISPGDRIEVPPEAFDPNGEWHAVIMPWQYRLFTVAMGSKSETRSGQLFYDRGVVGAEKEGSRVETPWGVMFWLGKPHDKPEIVPGDYEAGWLLRGTYDRAFSYDGPFIDPRHPADFIPADGMTVLESMYLTESKIGHGISLSVPQKPAGHWHGSLNIDPNTCMLNEFGDRTGCTKIAIRHREVEVTQLRLADPLNLGRSIFRIDGPDLPAPLALIADARFQRFHIKTDRELIPLFSIPPRR